MVLIMKVSDELTEVKLIKYRVRNKHELKHYNKINIVGNKQLCSY